MGLPGYTRNIWTWSRYREKDGESGRQSFTTENYDNYELRLRRKAEKKSQNCGSAGANCQDLRTAVQRTIQPFRIHSHIHHIFITYCTHSSHWFITLSPQDIQATDTGCGNCDHTWSILLFSISESLAVQKAKGTRLQNRCAVQHCTFTVYQLHALRMKGLVGTALGRPAWDRRQSQVGATFLIHFCLWCLWCLTWINMTDLALCSIFIFLIPLRWRKAPKTKQTWSIVINHGKGTPPGTSESGAKPKFKESEDNLDFSFAAEWHSRRHLEAFLIQFLSFWSRKVAPVVLPWV